MVAQYVIIGAVILAASIYLARRLLRHFSMKTGSCGGAVCGGGPAGDGDRLGKRRELIELGTDPPAGGQRPKEPSGPGA